MEVHARVPDSVVPGDAVPIQITRMSIPVNALLFRPEGLFGDVRIDRV